MNYTTQISQLQFFYNLNHFRKFNIVHVCNQIGIVTIHFYAQNNCPNYLVWLWPVWFKSTYLTIIFFTYSVKHNIPFLCWYSRYSWYSSFLFNQFINGLLQNPNILCYIFLPMSWHWPCNQAVILNLSFFRFPNWSMFLSNAAALVPFLFCISHYPS